MTFDTGFSAPSSGGKNGPARTVRLVRGGQAIAALDALAVGCTLDVDGNGAQDALTDGVIVLRALFGLTGAVVTASAIGTGTPTRTTWEQIQPFLNGKCWSNFAP